MTISIRRPVRTAFALLAVATVAITACGNDDDGSTPASTAAPATTAAPVADDLSLAEVLGLDPATDLGEGRTFPLGAVLALSGGGAAYGATMKNAIDLAVTQIAQAGGPTIEVAYKDLKSGDPVAGQTAITELGEAGYPAKITDYVDNLGSMLAGTEQYEIFTFDAGGGTSVFAQGLPFFWGTRAVTPTDVLPGILEYAKQADPEVSSVGWVFWDLGEPVNTIIKEDILAKIDAAGLTFNGLYELVPPDTTDFSAVLPKVTANQPDLLLLGLYGQDPGSFVDQAFAAGVDSMIIGSEFTQDSLRSSKGTFDREGYMFAYDYFDPNTPQNDLARLFVDSYRAAYGSDPDFYAANAYESTLGMWDVVRRVIEQGGDINDGAVLEEAFVANPTLPSVYGVAASGAGSMTLSLETHSVIAREMGVFQYKGGTVTPLARFNMNAEGFEML